MIALTLAWVVKISFVIAAAAAVNLLALRHASAATRHFVWTSAAAALLALPLLSVALPAWDLPIRVAVAAAPAPAGVAPAAAADVERSPTLAPVSGAAPAVLVATADGQTPGVGNVAGQAIGAASAVSAMTRLQVVLAAYLVGVMAWLARLFVEDRSIRRMAKRSVVVADPEWTRLLDECRTSMHVPQTVRLLRSAEAIMPMAFGIRRPSILIPAVADTWTDDRRRAVLAHELAHIGRRDCLTQLVAAIACALYWIHPGAWWVARRLRVERELACDDRVLAMGTAAREYAEHLLELAYSLGGSRAPALAASMARRGQLEGRMLAVLDAARDRGLPALGTRLAGVALAAILVAPLAAAAPAIVSTPGTVTGDTLLMSEASAPSAPLAPLASLSGAGIQSSDAARSTSERRYPGSWEMRQNDDSDTTVNIQLHERRNSMHGFSIAVDQLAGFDRSWLSGSASTAKFEIRREAGTITFDGMFRSGIGAGTYDFQPNRGFADALVKRGFASPTDEELYALAAGNVGVAFLDELNAQRYARPDIAGLVRAANHGVNYDYLHAIGEAGYHLGAIEPLIRMRDHGVTPAYIRGLDTNGVRGLTADQLVRARDHGVGPEFIAGMKTAGYGVTDIETLVNARDHGVAPEFAMRMRALGFTLGLEDLVRARDHGVTPDYADGMRQAGYRPSDVDALVRARDHGVDAAFARSFQDAGYRDVELDDLIRLRDHGVNAEFARRQNDGRSPKLTISQLIRIRDRGGL